MTLTIAVFSYNRGNYLRNCLDSIARNAPGIVVRIYDDASDDPETLGVLADHAALLAFGSRGQRSKHGGLYGNMQSALDDCTTDHLLFLQDDMQIVRLIGPADMQVIDALFHADPSRAFICPTFMKGIRLDQAARVLRRLPNLPAYALPPDADRACQAERYAYADVSIAHVGRLRSAQWQFENRERHSIEKARRLFSDMPYMAVPFAFFCPEVPVFRQRKVTLAARIAARVTGTDVKAFHDMTPDQVARLRAAPAHVWPIAEDYLLTVNPRVTRPFVYQDIKARKWLALMHRIELALRKR
jgi:glycosyltransferase involved in cell wall biosynthesis